MRIFNVGLMCDDAGNGWTEAVKRRATDGYFQLRCGESVAEFNQKLLQMTLDFRPQLIILQIQAPNILYPDVLNQISRIAFVIEYCGDVRHSLPNHYLETGRCISMSTFSNLRDVKLAREAGLKSEWVEIGYDPKKYKSWDVPASTEVVAHFNDYGDGFFPLSKYRREVVETMRNTFGDRFGVFGNFPGAKGNFNSDQISESKNYCGAKIALNVSHFCVEKYSSDRLLRALGSGVFVLSHYFEGIEEMYKVGEHLDVFHNLQELVEKVNYYLEHEDERKRIAAAGQEYVRRTYTFDNMIDNLISLCKPLLP
jgi:hypothetical protein